MVGPHFKQLCRQFALREGIRLFDGLPAEVAAGAVPDPANRTRIQVDVVVLAPAEPGRRRTVLSLGEVKWGKAMDPRHLHRLRRARDLLSARGYDTSQTVVACYGGEGFDPELRQQAGRERLAPIGVEELYG
ncbi:hypothetical protein [Thermoactinospora rubra]|uniref:hypothetical protein n=1 Tax=Thermoactinospora rubra TaxID=1088767 RepID=UPI000A0FA44F|nr:hypothetical protein [Thermoactinospora rubra]